MSAVEELAQVRALIADLRQQENELVQQVVDELGSGEHHVGPFIATVRSKPSSPRWDSEKLLPRVVGAALDERKIDPETGEVLEREAEVVVRVLADCAPLLNASTGWKTTGLKAHGIDPDDYRTVEGWSHTVQLRPAEEAVVDVPVDGVA